MKIKSSAVAMSGTSSYSHYQESTVTSKQMRASEWNALKQDVDKEAKENGVSMSISEQSQAIWEKYQQQQDEKSKQQKSDWKQLAAEQPKETGIGSTFRVEEDSMVKTLRQILRMLRSLQKRGGVCSPKDVTDLWDENELSKADASFSGTMNRLSFGQSFSVAGSFNVIDLRSNQSGTVTAGNSTAWIQHTEVSGFMMEQESTTFSATGVAMTEDGRSLEFGVDLSMSRGFAGAFSYSSDKQVILTDPLVINVGSDTASVSDQKFYFDLDSDGKKEEISSMGNGSGFLAYDRNGDGVINDGSELFGTKSGDGFADLAQYDADGNGWIDENDEIFNHLKVWMKDETGNDRLLSLKDCDVGAIYLGKADTQYHLNQKETNQTQAVIRQTGIFLRESGGTGTIQHVDLAV